MVTEHFFYLLFEFTLCKLVRINLIICFVNKFVRFFSYYCQYNILGGTLTCTVIIIKRTVTEHFFYLLFEFTLCKLVRINLIICFVNKFGRFFSYYCQYNILGGTLTCTVIVFGYNHSF